VMLVIQSTRPPVACFTVAGKGHASRAQET
jgi:hypothetical protein